MRSVVLSRPQQVCVVYVLCLGHFVCLLHPLTLVGFSSAVAVVFAAASLASAHCMSLAVTLICTAAVAALQVVSRGRLQIVAGQGQTGKSATKRKLGGGTGLPPIDGGVSCAAWMPQHTGICCHL